MHKVRQIKCAGDACFFILRGHFSSIADTFLKCALPVIGQVSGCRDGVTDQMKAESESLLTLASCRDRSSYYGE